MALARAIALAFGVMAAACAPAVRTETPWVAPTPTRGAIPARIAIPALGLDARIAPAGLDATGAMAVPGSADEVAWYELGGRPGEMDNAILAGHNVWGGRPAIFANLASIRPGEEIFVTNAAGGRFAYVVSSIASFPDAAAPIADIFGASAGASLTLITCSGTVDASGTYDDRLIVRAEGRT